MDGKSGRTSLDAEGGCAVMAQDNAMCERLTIREELVVAYFPA